MQKEAAIGGLAIIERQKIYDQIKLVKAKHENDMLNNSLRSVRLQLDLYDALFKSDGEPRSVTKLSEYPRNEKSL
jgi:hypothetical protein